MANQVAIVAFFNSYVDGSSGGDLRFTELFRRLSEIDKTIVGPAKGIEHCQSRGIAATYLATTKEYQVHSLVVTYLARMVLAAFVILFRIPSKKVSVIYSTSDFLPDTVPAAILKWRSKKRWVQVVHHLYGNPFARKGNNLSSNLLGFVSQRMSLFLIKRYADVVIVVNPLVKRQLVGMGLREARVRVSSNGVDFGRVRVNPHGKRYDCVFLGRLNASKGIFDLLDIWQKLKERGRIVTLAIIGWGDDQIMMKLKEKIGECELEATIDLCGFLDDAEAFASVNSSKVFVFPSHEESFGMAILEAMACGLPAVMWDLPAYDAIYTQGVRRVAKQDLDLFADQILSMLDDRSLYDLLSDQAKNLATQYSWDNVCNSELAMLRGEILSRHQGM